MKNPAVHDGTGFGAPEPVFHYTKKDQIRNWWHYHAGWVLLAAAAVLGTAYLIHDMFFRPAPDYQVAFVTRENVPAAVRSALQAQFEALGEDVNGDGRVLCELLVYPLGFDEASQREVEATGSAVTRLTVDLTTGGVFFLLLDDPEGFIRRIGGVAYLDGSAPPAQDAAHGADDWRKMVYSWQDCPVLAGLDLGEYEPFLQPGTVQSGQRVMDGIYVARRALYSDSAAQRFEKALALWEKMTQGAQRAA